MDKQNAPTAQFRTIGEGKKNKPFLLFAFLRRRIIFILILGSLCGLAVSLLVCPFAHPVYTTDAQLRLDPAKERTVDGRERDLIPGNIGDYSRTLVARLAGYEVVGAALRTLPVTNYPVFLDRKAEFDSNVYRLIAKIKVQEVPRSYLISATLTAPRPDGLGPTLNTLLQVFIDRIQSEQELQYTRRLTYLREERTKIVDRIEEQRASLLALASTVENKAFLHANYTAHLTKVEQVQRLYWEAEAVRAEKDGALKKALNDRAEIEKLNLQPYADERVADNFGINRIEQWTYEQLQGMRAGIDGLTSTNPDRQYVENRMSAMNDYLRTYKKRVNDETIKNLSEKRAYELEADIVKAQSAYRAADTTSRTLSNNLECARLESSAVSEAIFKASNLTFAIDQLRSRLAALENRIDDCELDAKSPVQISIDKFAVTPPLASTAQTNRKLLMLLGFAFGLGGVASVVLVFDVLDNRVRVPREVELALGAQPPDPIAAYESADSSRPGFAAATLDRPETETAHAIRELAVRLNAECERGGRVFVFSGLSHGCGTTQVAINVAHALMSFRPSVVLLEANLRRPGMADALGIPAVPGLETALRGERPWSELTRPDASRGIRVLPAEGGERPVSVAGLAQILMDVKVRDTTLIVDADSVLDDDVSYYIAAHADAVVFIARQDASLYRHLRLSIDRMTQSGVPALTAVLNDNRSISLTRVFDRVQDALLVVTRVHQSLGRRLRLIRIRAKRRKD